MYLHYDTLLLLLLDSLCSYKVVAKENQSQNQSLGFGTSNLTQVANTMVTLGQG